MRKILVTGGAGFIGSHVVDLLTTRGYEVTIIDNLSTGKLEFLNPKAKFYNVDINDDLEDIFKKEHPEIVIHMAAQTMLRRSIEYPKKDAKINILGTINVLESCLKNNVKKIIYTSTGGARVGEPEYLPVDEKHPINPISPYGISKHTAEHYVEMFSKLNKIDYLIYCFGNVYGPRDSPENKRLIPIFTYQILNGEIPKIFGDGSQTRDFIYVRDIAEVIVNNLDSTSKHKLFHLANEKQISVSKIFEILKNLLNYDGEAIHLEPISGEVRDIVFNTTLAKTELNWNPKYQIEEGMRETVQWYKNQKALNNNNF